MLSKLLPPPAYDTLVVQRQTTNGGTDRYTYNKVNHHHKRWIRSAATSAPPPPQPSTIKTIEPTPRGSSLNRAVVVQNNPKTKLPQQDGFLKQQQTQTPTSTTNKTPAGIQVLSCIAFVQSTDNFFTRAKRRVDFHRLLCVLIETPALVFISALVTLPVLRTSDLHDTHAPFP